MKRAIPQSTRRAVAVRAGATPGERTLAHCAKCGAEGTIWWPRLLNGLPGAWVHFRNLELDHVVPEFAGGTADPDNIALLCRSCNRRKGHKTNG